MTTPRDKPADDRMIVTLTLAELAEVIDARVRAVVRDELETSRAYEPKAVTCSVKEAAQELGATPRTIKRWIADGRLQASRACMSGSSRVRVLRESVDRMLRATRVA